jgi:hypothetical protein
MMIAEEQLREWEEDEWNPILGRLIATARKPEKL